MTIGPGHRRMATMRHNLDPTLAFSLYAFGHEMRLWKETNGNHWGAMVGNRSSRQVYYIYFEADDPTLAKLQVCTTARALAVLRMDRDVPACDVFLDSWHALTVDAPVDLGSR
jgi:hypothetical protein